MIIEQDVISWGDLEALEENELEALSMVVLAVNSYVESLPSIDLKEDGTWADTTRLGAIMLAARMYRRKNSPGGIEAVGEITTYVSRYDSDIARLLNIDSFKKPMVG